MGVRFSVLRSCACEYAGDFALQLPTRLLRIDPGRGAEAGLCIVALAIVIDRITQGFAKRYEESIA